MNTVLVQSITTERLEAEITTFAAHMTAAMCRWLLLVAEYDRRAAFEQWECVSMAQWLGVHVGISSVTARQQVAVARKLVLLPAIREAFGSGAVSYSRVRAICRIATPADEHEWVEMARHATAQQMDRIVSDTIRCVNASDPDLPTRQVAARRFGWRIDDDGMFHVSGVLAPEIGVLLAKLIAGERDAVPAPGNDYDQRNADAFGRLMQRLATGDTEGSATVLTVVHRYPDGTARLEGGPPVPPDTAERLAEQPDAEWVTATHTPGAIRYGRRHRRPLPSLRRYLGARDRCCRFAGCGATKRLAAHHLKEWVRDSGETVPANLVLLCPRHHGAIHNRGWTITANPETGDIEIRNPNGHPYPTSDTPGDPTAVIHENQAAGIEPGPDTIIPAGRGERYDHELTIWAIANRPRPDSAEPPPKNPSETHGPFPA